ncbi:hypothetical protein QX776_03260 [Alteromonadaceae bacterium BrNp21-10]|nr:hypothetical protein [Alteromonadaceae bacterium BrNp21-10]
MKALFLVAVLIAGGYLLWQSPFGQQQFSNMMPENDIQQAAEGLLDKVDQKMNQFNQGSHEQQQQIVKLQQQLDLLEQKVTLLSATNSMASNTPVNALTTDDSVIEQNPIAEFEPLAKLGSGIIAAGDTPYLPVNQEIQGNRQAGLRDIVDRMNQKSLQALVR